MATLELALWRLFENGQYQFDFRLLSEPLNLYHISYRLVNSDAWYEELDTQKELLVEHIADLNQRTLDITSMKSMWSPSCAPRALFVWLMWYGCFDRNRNPEEIIYKYMVEHFNRNQGNSLLCFEGKCGYLFLQNTILFENDSHGTLRCPIKCMINDKKDLEETVSALEYDIEDKIKEDNLLSETWVLLCLRLAQEMTSEFIPEYQEDFFSINLYPRTKRKRQYEASFGHSYLKDEFRSSRQFWSPDESN
jgi:hypothetical protein